MPLRSRNSLLLMTIGALALTAGNVRADGRFYGQLDLGRASIDETIDADGVFFDLDDSSSSWRVAVGYAFGDYFALEAGHVDFDSIESQFQSITVGAQADGTELAAVLTWPVSENFSFNIRAGSLRWDAETRVSSINASDSGSDLFTGLGLAWSVSERTAITAGWTRYELDDLEVSHASVGLRFAFGE